MPRRTDGEKIDELENLVATLAGQLVLVSLKK